MFCQESQNHEQLSEEPDPFVRSTTYELRSPVGYHSANNRVKNASFKPTAMKAVHHC